jgi:hypothetical protein
LIQTEGLSAAGKMLAEEEASAGETGDKQTKQTLNRIFDVVARQYRHAVASGADPGEACQWLAGYADKPFASAEPFTRMAAQLAMGKGPESAVEWMASIYSTNSANATQPGLAASMGQWAAGDPNSAGKWLQARRQHPAYAAMVTAFAKAVQEEDPEAAAAWRKTIE